MNRRQLLFLSLATLLMPRKVLAAEKAELPICPDGPLRHEGWKIFFDTGKVDLWPTPLRIEPDAASWSEESLRFVWVTNTLLLEVTTPSSGPHDFSFQLLVGGMTTGTYYADALEPAFRFTKDEFMALRPASRAGKMAKVIATRRAGATTTLSFSLKGFEEALLLGYERHMESSQMEEKGLCKHQTCFITSATCQAVGLPDNCFELTELRRYRDRVLAFLPCGGADIEEYYRLAPQLVPRLSRRESHKLYWLYILPCALLARVGFNRLTHAHYRRMMRRLVATHLPAGAALARKPEARHRPGV